MRIPKENNQDSIESLRPVFWALGEEVKICDHCAVILPGYGQTDTCETHHVSFFREDVKEETTKRKKKTSNCLSVYFIMGFLRGGAGVQEGGIPNFFLWIF